MVYKRVLSIIIGFTTIAFLSSLFAKVQGYLYPDSLLLFEHPVVKSIDVLQLIIKLLCIYCSCIAGGVVTRFLKGRNKELSIVGVGIMIVIGWLWLNTVNLLWFWILLLSGILPCVFLGSKMKDYQSRSRN
ncbi:hypothetical protein V1389_01575 [Flavobacterium rakeshii]|uniref:hypothetical protein n=1 Tax=Flavobacterium rakeshii TaxID=1038845 RepID=UPI002E7B2915|nr:hypothetical protein [Flavobacterium rakeshii]MEE1897006.1 hypothetical protein [Flavobacterium rakeshii]